MSITAGITAAEQSRKEQEKRMFELQVEAFCREWAPSDPYERSRFESQLFSLVRQIYRDAQQPVLDQLGKMASHIPLIFPQTGSRREEA